MKRISTSQEKFYAGRVIKLIPALVLFLMQQPSSANAGEKELVKSNNTELYKKSTRVFLPIVWTPLKGYYSQGKTFLTWSSLQESNSSHFEIQRSSDGVNFQYVGKVMALSSSDKVVEYGFNDTKTNEGVNYFRVKYHDNDGNFQFSNTLVLNVRIRGINITAIYPGPFVDKVHVTVSSEMRTTGTITLYDNTGKPLVSRQQNLHKGVTTIILDKLDNLARGTYIIRVQAGETIVTQRLIK